MDLLQNNDELVEELGQLSFSAPVAHVYNPLVYARVPHLQYLTKYGSGAKEAVFVGMNPGPWGMAQTGVPFGEVKFVKGWMGIEGEVSRPAQEHPKKRVQGFSCHRSEVSGLRLWGAISERYPDPSLFFKRFFVINYCPLLFLTAEGQNITPDKLKTAERLKLLEVCDRALKRSIQFLSPSKIIGVGNFAAEQAAAALEGLPVKIGKILHPSPSNPQANRNWKEIAIRQLKEQGIDF